MSKENVCQTGALGEGWKWRDSPGYQGLPHGDMRSVSQGLSGDIKTQLQVSVQAHPKGHFGLSHALVSTNMTLVFTYSSVCISPGLNTQRWVLLKQS